MAWVRLDDTFPEHPKVLDAGGDAGWLHVCAIAYSSRNLTDGFVPTGALRQLSDRKQPAKLAEALVDAGLWERVERGFVIHDYLEYNPTRAEVEAERAAKSAKKAEAGRLGGIASGVSRRKHNRSTPEANGSAEPNENVAPTRPDPTPREQVRDLSTSENTGEGVDISDRLVRIAHAYGRLAVDVARQHGTVVADGDLYAGKARRRIAVDPELSRIADLFPTAPDDVIAAALHGEKHSLGGYPRADELATVHRLHGDQPA